MSAVEPAAPPAGPLHAEKMYATPGSARYAVAPREDGLCDDKSESLFKFILSFVLDCPKLSIRFVQRFLSVNSCHRERRFIKVRQDHKTSNSMHERARNVGAPSQGRPRQGTRSRQRHCEHLHEATHRGRTSPSPLELTARTGSYASTCGRSRQALPDRSDPFPSA